MLRSIHFQSLGLTALLAVGIIGCSTSDLPKPVSVAPAAPPALKAMLEEVAKTGELGSAAESLKSDIEKLKESDQSKGNALLADLQKLEKLSDREAIKALAKQMAEKV